MNRALATIALLILSNTFMTLAWYGHIAFKSKIERLIGNAVKIGDSTCCCEFQPRKGGSAHSLPLAIPLGRRCGGNESEDLP